MPTKTTGAKRGRALGEKSTFVMAQRAELTAAEIQEKAKKRGIKITVGHIYTIRSMAKKRQTEARARRKSRKRTGNGAKIPNHAVLKKGPKAHVKNAAVKGSPKALLRLHEAIVDLGIDTAELVVINYRKNLAPLLRKRSARGRASTHAS